MEALDAALPACGSAATFEGSLVSAVDLACHTDIIGAVVRALAAK